MQEWRFVVAWKRRHRICPRLVKGTLPSSSGIVGTEFAPAVGSAVGPQRRPRDLLSLW